MQVTHSIAKDPKTQKSAWIFSAADHPQMKKVLQVQMMNVH